jgi:hypothetical protein
VHWRITIPMTVAMLALVGIAAAVTKYSLAQTAILAPVVVATAGAVAFLVLLWAKVIRESLRRRPPA